VEGSKVTELDYEDNWSPDNYLGYHPRVRPKLVKAAVPSTFKDLKLGILSERWNFDENVLPLVEDLGGKKGVRISGIACMADVVSLNRRKYIDEELTKSARTWISKPITINHSPPKEGMKGYDRSKIVGDIRWMEQENGKMRYAGVVTKQPWVELLRSRSTEIKHVSLEADFLTNECPTCGKFFATDALFYDHAATEHFNKNLERVPRGIVGSALSLVLAPEIAGIEGTTVELAETFDGIRPFAQLAESLVTIREGGFAVVKSGIAFPVKGGKLGEPCSPELRACVDELVASGKDESSAYAICRSQLGESLALKGLPKTEPVKDVTLEDLKFLQSHTDLKVREAFGRLLSTMDGRVREAEKRVEDTEMKVGLTETVTERDTLKEATCSQHKTILKLEEEISRRDGLVEENRKLQIENDNIRDKVKSQFKGQAKQSVAKVEYYGNPIKDFFEKK
jgi:hypothetical protein